MTRDIDPIPPNEEQFRHLLERDDAVVYPLGKPCQAQLQSETDMEGGGWNTVTTRDALPDECPHCGESVEVPG